MVTVAILYPGHSAEDEFRTLQNSIPDASFPVVHTWQGSTEHDVDALLALGAERQLVPAAREARRHGPDAVIWACTSGSFVYGWDGCRDQARWIREAAGVPASSTSLAFAAAVHHLGATSVAVAATYPREVTAYFVALLEHDGITVTATTSHGVPSGEAAGALDDDRFRRIAHGTDLTGAQCLLIPDTALHTVREISVLETALGVPVLTANQVTAWHGLRLAGHTLPAEGLGILFERP